MEKILLIVLISVICGLMAGILIQYYWLKRKNDKREKKFIFLRTPKRIVFVVGVICLSVLAGVAFYLYDYSLIKSIRYFVLIYALIAIGKVDVDEEIIPNKMILALIWIRVGILIAELVINWNSTYLLQIFLAPILGLLVGGGLFLFSRIISRGGIGMGDVKLFAVIGMYTGVGVLMPCIIVSLFVSAAYSLIMLARHKIGLKDSFPFGPFAAIGTILTLLVGF